MPRNAATTIQSLFGLLLAARMILRPSTRPPHAVAPARCRKDIAENGKAVGWHLPPMARRSRCNRAACGCREPGAERRGLFLAIRPVKNFLSDRILHCFGNVIGQETHPIVQSAASPIRDRRPSLTARGR